MKTFIKSITTPLKVLILSAVVILGTQIAIAWTGPTQTAPDGNVEAPLNVGGSVQIKSGGLIIANGGVDPGLIVASGNVGIGTASPTAKLDVSGSAKATSYVIGTSGSFLYDSNGAGTTAIRSGATGAYKYFTFDTNGTFNALNGDVCTTLGGGVCLSTAGGGTGGGPGTGTANYMTKWLTSTTLSNTSSIFDNGNVAIGTAVPLANTKLTVNGNVSLNAAAGSGIYFGNVGVGLPGTAGEKIQLNGTTRGTNSTADYSIGIDTNTMWFNTSATGGYKWYKANVEKMKMDSNGDVTVDGWLSKPDVCGTGVPGTSATINLTTNGNFISAGNCTDNNLDNLYLGTGAGLIVGHNGTVIFSVDSGGNTTANGYYYFSDQSLKKNIKPLQDSLSKIMQLKSVSFDWKDTGKSDVGLIAQDVEKVYPELVHTDTKTGLKSVEYGNLVSPLIQAVQQQQKEIEDLQAQVKELQNK